MTRRVFAIDAGTLTGARDRPPVMRKASGLQVERQTAMSVLPIADRGRCRKDQYMSEVMGPLLFRSTACGRG